ncbi:thioredoxin [Paenibacillus sp. GYB003]|uniref:thioredoxin n=1 Tax=Paenibacillus sp. GYB003 TaxID=2994392 RepID=UPI002F961339
MTVCHSSDSTFRHDMRKEGYTIVNFWAPWCSPCQLFAPVLEAYDSDRRDDVRIVKINVDENAETASFFGVMSLPTTLLFKDGKPVDKKIGYMSKEALTKWVSANR